MRTALFHREHRPGFDRTIVEVPPLREYHLTARSLPGENLNTTLGRLGSFLLEHPCKIVRQEVFGSLAARRETLEYLKSIMDGDSWPVTWIEDDHSSVQGLSGTHLFAISGTEVRPLLSDGEVCGTLYQTESASHCILGDVNPRARTVDQSSQAEQVFEQLARMLELAGMDFSHLARTWFFLDGILGWYPDFNRVRNDVYSRHQVIGRLIPASTGIGARNSALGALVAGAWAIRSAGSAVRITPIPSPLQCPAPGYGSCFSRAVELSWKNHRQLLISGTASIDPAGKTAHVNDIGQQIELTFQVVDAILQSRHMSLRDVTRATAYLRRPADLPFFANWCAQRGLALLPLVTTRADVCRDDLLFELELDAIASGTL